MKQLIYKYSNNTRWCVLFGIILICVGFFGFLGVIIVTEEYQIKLALITVGLNLIGLILFQIGMGRASREINNFSKKQINDLGKK